MNTFSRKEFICNYNLTPFSIPFIFPHYKYTDSQPLFESKTYGGTGIQKCSMDYLLLDGIRFCGARLSSMGFSTNAETDTPIFGTQQMPATFIPGN